MASSIRKEGMCFASCQEKVNSQLPTVAEVGGRRNLLHSQASIANPLHLIFPIPLSLSPEQEFRSVGLLISKSDWNLSINSSVLSLDPGILESKLKWERSKSLIWNMLSKLASTALTLSCPGTHIESKRAPLPARSLTSSPTSNSTGF